MSASSGKEIPFSISLIKLSVIVFIFNFLLVPKWKLQVGSLEIPSFTIFFYLSILMFSFGVFAAIISIVAAHLGRQQRKNEASQLMDDTPGP